MKHFQTLLGLFFLISNFKGVNALLSPTDFQTCVGIASGSTFYNAGDSSSTAYNLILTTQNSFTIETINARFDNYCFGGTLSNLYVESLSGQADLQCDSNTMSLWAVCNKNICKFGAFSNPSFVCVGYLNPNLIPTTTTTTIVSTQTTTTLPTTTSLLTTTNLLTTTTINPVVSTSAIQLIPTNHQVPVIPGVIAKSSNANDIYKGVMMEAISGLLALIYYLINWN